MMIMNCSVIIVLHDKLESFGVGEIKSGFKYLPEIYIGFSSSVHDPYFWSQL
jgi:hypothetical protein